MANPTMEKQARIVLRNALVMHYIVGIDAGEAVEAWLNTHGGWLPDNQETYGDGSPEMQPADEGEEVMSAEPEVAMVEAKSLLQRLVDTVGEDVHDPLGVLPGARQWLHDLTLSRKRSRSPPPPPSGLERVRHLTSQLIDQAGKLASENALLKARIGWLEEDKQGLERALSHVMRGCGSAV